MSVMWTYALPGALTSAVMALSMWLGRLMLTRQPDGYVELGLFEAANQWRMLVLFVPDVLARAVMPILAASYGVGASDDFRRTVELQVLALCSTAAPIVIVVIGIAKPLAMVFGAQFVPAAHVIPVLVMAVFFYALNQAVRQTYNAIGRRWINFAMYLLWAVVLLGASLLLVAEGGAVGFAWAMLAAEVILFLVQSLFVEFRLFPCALRRSSGVLALAIGTIVAQYLAWSQLTGVWSLFIGLPVLAVAMGPGVRLIWRRGRGGS
jgi:O-antigen/teichoic acid export membrane protein